jgi:glutamine cyclotransferase
MSSGLPDEPKETLGCGVLAGLELVADEVLESVGLQGSSELAVSDFLSITMLFSSRLWLSTSAQSIGNSP